MLGAADRALDKGFVAFVEHPYLKEFSYYTLPVMFNHAILQTSVEYLLALSRTAGGENRAARY